MQIGGFQRHVRPYRADQDGRCNQCLQPNHLEAQAVDLEQIDGAPPSRAQNAARAHGVRRVAFIDGGIGALRARDLRRRGHRAHRCIADHCVVLKHRRYVGQHPVEAAVLASVLDEAAPRLAGLQRGPQIGEGGLGHVRVAHEVVRCAHQLLMRIPADAHERRVGEDDATFEIGAGDEVVRRVEGGFGLGDRQILAHGGAALRGRGWS